MTDNSWGLYGRKRKRRRGPERPPLPTQLVLDTRLKGDFGILSEDLYDSLFHATNREQDQIHYVAISPQTPPMYRQPDVVSTMLWLWLSEARTQELTEFSDKASLGDTMDYSGRKEAGSV